MSETRVNYFKPRTMVVYRGVELCWICEKPLMDDGVDAEVEETDIVTVHTYCRDARWGTDEQWTAAYRWGKAEALWIDSLDA